MPAPIIDTGAKKQVYEQILDTLKQLFGKQPGYRYIHAKGVLCRGRFFPSPASVSLSRARLFLQSSVPVIARFSNFSGNPAAADNDPANSPRGMVIRLMLPDGAKMDIMAHSYNGFPVSNVEDFLGFVQGLAASPPDSPRPTLIEKFLAGHPGALRFAQEPKPVPASFATLSYYAADTFRFINGEGTATYGRFRIHPLEAERFLEPDDAAKRNGNFLFDDLRDRLGQGSALFRLAVQIPGKGDPIADASARWPDERPQVDLGIIAVDRIDETSEEVQKTMAFDPTNLADGIEISEDVLPLYRSAVYALALERRGG